MRVGYSSPGYYMDPRSVMSFTVHRGPAEAWKFVRKFGKLHNTYKWKDSV